MGVGHSQHGAVGVSGVVLGRGERALGHQVALGVVQTQRGGREPSAEGAAHGDGGGVGSQSGGGDVVEERRAGARQEVDVPEDPGGAELVLVLQVGAVAPLEHQDGQAVGARLNDLGDVELAGGVGDLAVADVLAVEPHVEAGVHTLQDQVGLRRVRVRRVLDVAQIDPAGIVLGNEGRIEGDGVADVGVLVPVVPLVLPGAGHGHPIHAVQRDVAPPEGLGHVVDARVVGECPLAVEEMNAVGALACAATGGDGCGGGQVVGPWRQGALVEGLEILIVPGNDRHWCSWVCG